MWYTDREIADKLTKEKKKIGILGGTFDPIHNGHICLARAAQHEIGLDEVWFMPSQVTNRKMGTRVSDAKHRIRMTQLAIEDTKAFIYSGLEIENEERTYSYLTMEYLKEEYSDSVFYFLVGEDAFSHMDKWICSDRLFSSCIVTVMQRGTGNGIDFRRQLANAFSEQFHCIIGLLDVPELKISSTDIRNGIAHGEKFAEYLDEKVLSYIRRNNLYTDQL